MWTLRKQDEQRIQSAKTNFVRHGPNTVHFLGTFFTRIINQRFMNNYHQMKQNKSYSLQYPETTVRHLGDSRYTLRIFRLRHHMNAEVIIRMRKTF